MMYIDLPYEYRTYATNQGWGEDQALAYWQQAKEYREYMVAQTTSLMSIWMCSGRKKAGTYMSAYNNTLRNLRGHRAKAS